MPAQVLDHGAQADARGAARCLSQVIDRGAQAVARGAARCVDVHAPQVLDRGAQPAALSQQENSNSEDVQRGKVILPGRSSQVKFILTIYKESKQVHCA
jgi:hypothetical protein